VDVALMDEQHYDVLIVALLIAVSTLTLAIALKYPVPVGVDIHFHLEVARIWSHFENGGASDYVMQIN